MSDYLAMLVARVHPSAPPIEPRRSSLFEPPARETAPAAIVGDSSTPQAPSAPSPRPGAAREAPHWPPPPVQSAPVPAPVPPARAPEPLRHRESPPPVPLPEPVRSVAPAPVPEDPRRGNDRLVPIAAPPAPVAAEAAPSSRVLIETIIREPARPPGAADPDKSSEAVLPRPAMPLLVPPPVRLLDVGPGRHESRPEEPATASSPAIHVTIGRVEVRAVVPPQRPASPQPAARKAPHVIPLDDYLRQQSSPAARA